MKGTKIGLLVMALIISIVSTAQITKPTHLYVQSSIGMSDNFVREFVELGVVGNNNRVGIYSESFVNNNAYRKYFLGLKYARLLPLINNVIVAEPGLGVDTRLNGFRHGGETLISARPELALRFNADWFSIVPAFYAQYMERERSHYGAKIGIGITF